MSRQASCCATIVDELVRSGVRHAVMSPGSRSTPLVLALFARAEIELHVVLDERSAAFVALGIGKSSGRPAVVVCTSGTAAANHHPAVVEASLSGVPMIVCTADRPPELHDVGAPQTINQVGLFGRAVEWEVDFDPEAFEPASWRGLVSRVAAEASSGPVHINLRLREPLIDSADEVPPGRDSGAPWHRVVSADALWEPEDDLLAEIGGRRLLVVGGHGAGRGGAAWLARSPWPVIADPLSGLRRAMPGVIGAFDSIVRAALDRPDLSPEVVLHLGAPPASKVLGQWLDGLGALHIVVGDGPRWLDPARTAAVRIEATPASVASALIALTSPPPDLLQAWSRAERAAQAGIEAVLGNHAGVTEPGVARGLVAELPVGSELVVASSMPVRDVEWFSAPRDGLQVRSNRGANGIDGVTSTALGVALADPHRPVSALLGDLAFLHDASGLGGIAGRACALTLVVIDNRGGGIFSFLPQASALRREQFELLFGTPQNVDLRQLCIAHDIPVVELSAQADLAPLLAESRQRGGVRAIIARTDRAENVALHQDLNAAVAAAIASSDSST